MRGERTRDTVQERLGAGTDRRERGSGTVLMLTLMMLLGWAGAVALVLGAAVSVRHRAETAADLAALAAASAAANGGPPACAVARRVATANGAQLAECSLRGTTVELSVSRDLHGPLARLPPARARARAGPASEAPGP